MLGVAGADLVEGLPEQGKLEDIAARVDLADGLLLGRAVALLDDAEESAGGVAKDTAEPHRIVHLGRAQQAGRPFVLLARQQIGQGLRPQERLVADQNHGRALIIRQKRPADLHGMAGAELLGLGREEDVGLAAAGSRGPDRRHSRPRR